MRMIRKIAQILLAGTAAFLLLCLFCGFYFRPALYRESTLGNTDFVWPAGASWMQMVEGISWGTYDDRGFNNPRVMENPDILVLGSSHMEATYVHQDQLLSVQLQQMLEGRASVYNMGISGCHLPQTLQYLEKTLQIYDPAPRLLLIEAHDLCLTKEQADAILSCSIPSIFEPKTGLKGKIMGLPYLRLLAKQKNMGLFTLLNPPRKPAPAETWEMPEAPYAANVPGHEAYDPVFSHLNRLQEQYHTKILIFYQPTEQLQKDGSVLYPQDPWIRVFESKCRQYDIEFLNLTDGFLEMYEEEHKLPHGFSTGRLGVGHLNADGHRAIALAVCDWIAEKEEA